MDASGQPMRRDEFWRERSPNGMERKIVLRLQDLHLFEKNF
jgi:hypothetical protein